MTEEFRNDRAGHIQLARHMPRGVPFLKPLYAPPPYQYTDDVVLILVYEADAAAVREVLPAELESLPDRGVAMCFFMCPDVTGLGAHNFAMPCIPVRYGDLLGQFVPYLYTSTDRSLAAYREGQGWPAVLAQTELVEARGHVRARVIRNGREVVRATASVSGDPIRTIDFLPIILYKEIPSADGRTCDAAYFMTSTSRLTNVELRAGMGTLEFPDPGDDPVARLAATRVSAVLYGTLDDLYPETMRVLP